MSSNKLRKPQPISATMALASSSFHHVQSCNSFPNLNIEAESTSTTVKMQPLTAVEQYWATRALKAEALLAAHENHQKEVKTLEHVQEMKRERELKILAQEHKEKHAYLERLLIYLVFLVVLLIIVIIYLATHYTRHSMLLQYKQHESWWSAVGASHFTIPILSPFTSVVERETSVIGAKLLGTLAAIIACLAYLAFRHWLNKISAPSRSLLANITSAASTTVSRAIDR